MKRIEDNEKRLDNLNNIVCTIDKDLNSLEKSIKDYKILNKYYGSKEWFKDKANLENGKIKNVKAGVLSEDAVWNLDEDIKDILNRMKKIIEFIEK